MNPLVGWLARQLGDLDPSGFDRWQWLWGRYPSPGWLLAGLALVGVFLWLSYRASQSIESVWRRRFVLALRTVAVGLLGVIFFDPSIELLKTRKREQSLVILVDASRSMSLRIPGEGTRIEHVRKLLHAHAEEIDRLERRFKVYYGFFDAVYQPTTRDNLLAVRAERPQTLIGESIDTLAKAFGADPPVGIVLFSDGADRGRVRAALGASDALSPIPVYPVLLPQRSPPDVAVVDVVTDPYAFVRNAFDIRGKIEQHGLAAERIDVTLRVDGQVVATQQVVVPKKASRAEFVFRTTPQRVGRYVYSVEIPTFDGEAVIENNRKDIIVKVVRDRVRVLQVVGEPSWDERFLRRYLEKDPNVDLISFMILRTREDLDATPESELSLIPFPTRELFTQELKTFDLVIFQNFDFRPYFDLFPGQLLENIRKFVEEDGGGFLMIGGDKSFSQGGYAGTVIERILPVTLDPTASIAAAPFTPVLTPDGARHPVASLDLPPNEADRVWRELPELQGTNVVGDLRPGALALLRHPSLRGGASGMPILSVMEAGKGRSMALTIDSSWLWGFYAAGLGHSGLHYQRFWNNAVRWLVHDPEFGRVRLESDADTYLLGDTVLARCSVLDENYRPAVQAQVEISMKPRAHLEGRQTEWVRLSSRESEPGVFTVEHTPQAGGVYDLRCSAKVRGKSAGEDGWIVIVDPLGDEMKDTAVHNELLRELAARSGGKTLSSRENWFDVVSGGEPEHVDVIGKQVLRLWDNAVVLLLLGVLWTTEWLLRRRWGGL